MSTSRKIVAALAGVFVCYCASWMMRHRLGVIHPMANLRYFYYGAAPGSRSDHILYALYWPAYGLGVAAQDLQGDRREIHWSDRIDLPPS